LVSYLRGRNWTEEGQGETSGTWWTLTTEEGETFEVLVPLDSNLRDYPNGIADVLKTSRARG